MVTATRDMNDDAYMDQALTLAERGRGQTSPNPLVGALLVSEAGVVVGTGFHERAGMAHAEVRALGEAGVRAHDATLYCTLEPCSHVGRTGPCVLRIVEAGVRRVVIGIVDPNPRVSGTGIAYLREHGLQVDVGVRGVAAARLNEEFLTWVSRDRPFVTMKIATSLDGGVAAESGVRTPLTSEEANAAVHQLRSEVDAVAVGSNTILVDDPLLTARKATRTRPLMRVVFDRRMRTPPTAALLSTLEAGPVVVITTERAIAEKPKVAARLRAAGARLEPLEVGDIAEAMRRLAKLEITSLLLEGGTMVHRAAWSAGVVDRVQRYVAPVTLGPTRVSWLDDDMSMSGLRDVRVKAFGPDVLIEGYVQRVD